MSWLEGVEETVQDDDPPIESSYLIRSLKTPINKIQEKIFIGSKDAAEDLELLQRNNISHILQVCCGQSRFTKNFHYKVISICDEECTCIYEYFQESFEFIEEAITYGTGILIHCQGGVSRSATIIIAYLIKKFQMTFEDALHYVQSSRPVVQPNLGFQKQLKEYEVLIKIKN